MILLNFRYERVPRWIGLVGLVGIPIAAIAQGLPGALGFAVGAAGSWWNYDQLQKVVKSLAVAAEQGNSPPPVRIVLAMFARLCVVAAAALVILKYSKSSLIGLLVGLFAACIAIGLELFYEIVWAKSTKSG